MNRIFPCSGFVQAATFSLATAIAGTAIAGNTVVVELYTSQGCSSCPAADRILGELVGQDGIVPLTLNVDYWDYLGWKDDLALPGNSKRQRAYAHHLRSRHVYTPQMMVDGKMDVVGSRRSQVDSAIASYRGQNDAADVTTQLDGDSIRISVNSAGAAAKAATVWLVGYDARVTRQVGGGENRGRTISYANVVREWREAGQWDGATALTLTSARPAGDGGYAVIVQQDGVGPILGAKYVTY